MCKFNSRIYACSSNAKIARQFSAQLIKWDDSFVSLLLTEKNEVQFLLPSLNQDKTQLCAFLRQATGAFWKKTLSVALAFDRGIARKAWKVEKCEKRALEIHCKQLFDLFLKSLCCIDFFLFF